MNEYTAGDLVEAVKGKSVKSQTVIRGQLTRLGDYLWVGDSGRTPENLESYGFTLSIVEKAAVVVVLPTEPGYYRVGGNNAHVEGTIQLLDDGEWWWVGNRYKPLPHRISTGEVGRNHAPLTPLAPVSETAKKVLDRVLGWYGDKENRALVPFIAAVAVEFGAEL